MSFFNDVGDYVRRFFAHRALAAPGAGEDHTAALLVDQTRRTVDALHPRQMRLKVVEVTRISPTSKALRFVRTDGPLPPFRAGQYICLHCRIGDVRTSRPYSISSAPGQPWVEIAVREVADGFVAPHLLREIGPGDELMSSGPLGHFYCEPLIDGDELVLLAGGSGITPFMSIIRQQQLLGWPLKITLLYGSRDADDVIYGDELRTLAADADRFRCAIVLSEPPADHGGLSGMLDAELIRDQVGSLEDKTFYLCGPPEMLSFCQAQLRSLGIPLQRVRQELSGTPADITRAPGWPPDLDPEQAFVAAVSGRKIPIKAGEPLISSLERHGIVVPAQCRSGECSACRTRLLSGEVFTAPGPGRREIDERFGYIHACNSYPMSDVELVVSCPPVVDHTDSAGARGGACGGHPPPAGRTPERSSQGEDA